MEITLNKYEDVIVVDDGGFVLSKVDKILKTNKLKGVEQTSSGYRKILSTEMNFPILNVARSNAKLELESPIIAEAVRGKFDLAIKELNLNPDNVLVIGSGYIGNNITNKFNDYETFNYDIDDGLKIEKILGDYDVVIGCSGNSSIKPEHYPYLKKNSILVSTSSSDREFSAVHLRRMVKSNTDCHSHLKVGDYYLLNSGFPINFDGSEVSCPIKKIQLTLALMYSGICQVKTIEDKKGFIGLEEEIQKSIINKSKEYSLF
jgi:S-adenosylhomocysteine hydrolase